MWLIDTASLCLKFFPNTKVAPPYAILSHTWEDEELSFQDFADLSKVSHKKGLTKVTNFCRLLSNEHGWRYAWVDTCCIDKSSSAELSEAINSMFDWYQAAEICYVYLADVDPADQFDESLRRCRWLTRGWTLQELIAPRKVEFYDKEWNFRSSRNVSSALLSGITNINEEVLNHGKKLESISVAKRMSWAAFRETTRIEDLSYCLLGIFQVNMPLIYGEGPKAFIRLQEEIIKNSNDVSIFAWQSSGKVMETYDEEQPYHLKHRFSSGLLARSPRYFKNSGHLKVDKSSRADEFAITNVGIRFVDAPLFLDASRGALILPLNCYHQSQPEFSLGIYIMLSGSGYLRDFTGELAPITRWKPPPEFKSIYIRKFEAFKRTPILDNHIEYYIQFDLSRSTTGFGLVFNEPSENSWDPVHKILKVSQNQTGYMIFTLDPLMVPSTFILVAGKTQWQTPWAAIFERGQSPVIFESLRDMKRLTELVRHNPQHDVSIQSGPLKLMIHLEHGPGDNMTARVHEKKLH